MRPGHFWKYAILPVLLIIAIESYSQISSESYKIPTGGPTSGGGVSSSASNSLTGYIPPSAAGISGSSSYNLAGGIIAAAFKGTLIINNPPTASCPGDTTIRQCAFGEICIPGFSCGDPDNNLDSCLVSIGALKEDTVCFTPTDTGLYAISLIAKDKLGLADTCSARVRVSLNVAPAAICPHDTTIFVCSLNSLCLPGFSASDPDRNIASKSIAGGTLKGDTVCFTPVYGENTLIFIVTDSCGTADTCRTKVSVNLNQPPSANSPGDTSIVVWSLADTICLPGFEWSDPDHNIASVQVRSGVLKGNTLCFQPVTGINSLWLKVTDSCGLSDTTATRVTISPAYSHNYLDTIPATGDTLKIVYGGGTAEGTFYYRLGGQATFSSAAMIQGADDTLIYPIPANLFTARGLEYYFTIIKNSKTINIGTAANPYSFVVQLTNAQALRPTAMPEASYRIISVPVGITGSKGVQNIFGDDLGIDYTKKQWRLASYNNNTNTYVEYPNSADVKPGQGYWLIAKGGKKYGAAGYSLLPNRTLAGEPYYEISLDSGWNQTGNPLPFDIDWSMVRFDDNGTVATGHPTDLLDDAAYWYSGTAYTQATNLPAWDGFFINIKKKGVKALFPYQENLRDVSGKQPLQILAAKEGTLNWYVEFTLEASGSKDDMNFAGVCSDALDGYDKYDFGEPPPAPEGAYLAFVPSSDNSSRFRVDIRPASNDGIKWNIVMGEMPGRTLKLTKFASIPNDADAWLVLDNGSEFRVTEDMNISIPDNVHSARFLVGSTKFMKSEGVRAIPSEYALSQNYPNPFNMTTNIKFALPIAGQVDLEIFNILGQRIRMLISDDMPAGFHQAIWDGCDEAGRPVASGVYFARLKSGEYAGYRKMMLLK